MEWEPYDPSWLVELAREQYPDKPWLLEALEKCTRCLKSNKYIYFVNPKNPDKLGSEWQYEMCLSMTSPKEGWLLLQILKNNRVGGVEFAGRKG